MSRRSSLALALILVAVAGSAVASGCGAGSGGPGDPSAANGGGPGGAGTGGGAGASQNPPVPRDRFVSELIDALCSTLAPCCAAAGYDHVASACTAALSGGDAGVTIGVSTSALDNPELTYDPQAAGDCIAYFRAFNEACSQPSTEDGLAVGRSLSGAGDLANAAGCYRMIRGPRQPGEPCTEGWFSECAPGPQGYAFCARARGADGGLAETATCHRIQTVPLGSACDGHDPSEAKDHTLRMCDSPVTSYEGYADQDALLRDMVLCDPATKTCKKGSDLYPRAGEPCGADRACMPSAYCGADGVCEARVGAGQSCATDRCSSTSTCKDGVCVARKRDGEPCTSSSECLGRCNARDVCAPFDGIANRAVCTGQTGP
ncbi:MAG: hypothetical protein KIS78_02590 [Labilithrix sp.]|nr:hypothetical protein [Labilithrix sp.]